MKFEKMFLKKFLKALIYFKNRDTAVETLCYDKQL